MADVVAHCPARAQLCPQRAELFATKQCSGDLLPAEAFALQRQALVGPRGALGMQMETLNFIFLGCGKPARRVESCNEHGRAAEQLLVLAGSALRKAPSWGRSSSRLELDMPGVWLVLSEVVPGAGGCAGVSPALLLPWTVE